MNWMIMTILSGVVFYSAEHFATKDACEKVRKEAALAYYYRGTPSACVETKP